MNVSALINVVSDINSVFQSCLNWKELQLKGWKPQGARDARPPNAVIGLIGDEDEPCATFIEILYLSGLSFVFIDFLAFFSSRLI